MINAILRVDRDVFVKQHQLGLTALGPTMNLLDKFLISIEPRIDIARVCLLLTAFECLLKNTK